MNQLSTHRRHGAQLFKATPLLLAVLAANTSLAAESSKFRQSAVGLFGGEIAAPGDNPGFFGTASLAFADIYKVVDGSGNPIALPGRTVPLATGTPTGGAVPNGTYALNVGAGTIDFSQKQTQLNLVGGYVTQGTYGGGHLVLAVNVPLIKAKRTFVARQPLGTVSPTPPGATPAPLLGAINAVANATNNAVQAGVAASASAQNADVSGVGDTEVVMAWSLHAERLKVVAGLSVWLPTGEYDKNRGPNPGFGDFYTVRTGVAVTYALNPKHTDAAWDAGVTVAGRVAVGTNSSNKETNYKSGSFVYFEGGIVKVTGDFAFGANLLGVQQISDDTGSGVAAGTGRYKNFGGGPFVSYKLPGKDAGFNLHYSENFGSRNAIVAKTVQLRFIKAW